MKIRPSTALLSRLLLLLLLAVPCFLVHGEPAKSPPAAEPACCCDADEQQLLTSRPRPAQPKATPAQFGDRIDTAAGQRRRLAMPDGSILFVNEGTSVQVEKNRTVALTSGEVYVEAGPGDSAFTVKSPRGEISGRDASFAVRTDAVGPSVLVSRGQARVSSLAAPLSAGQQLVAGSARPVAAPRLSHLLAWTRELMAAAEAPLVPGSAYSGGALVAIDPNGQEAKLTLRKYHVDVFLEDGFARTTIDQTYFNNSSAQMEGTFFFPLPADASVSHLAMYVDGNLMEAGMVERDLARQVYETIRYERRDPALLEWVDGSTFKMRVFPIEGRQEKRVLLSYTQKLDSLYGQAQYRFPAGHSLPKVREWSFQARVKDGAGLAWHSSSHALEATKEQRDLLLRASAKDARVDRDVVLAVTDTVLAGGQAPDGSGDPSHNRQAVRFSSAERDGATYLMMRLRPDLLRPGKNDATATGPRHWVFLFESSGDRDPLLARAQVEVIRNLLAQLGPTDTFDVLAAGTRVRAAAKQAASATPANMQKSLEFLENSHLVGALDLGSALAEAGGRARQGAENYVVHVGSGVAAMGTRGDAELAAKLPPGMHYVGVGVGKRWARGFMKATAERTGGYFTQINPDEPIAWRSFELFSTLQTLAASPLRRLEIPGELPRFLVFNHFPAGGEELCAIARLAASELPASVNVRFGDGDTVAVPVQNVKRGADYLPRSWARLEIDRLLSDNVQKNKDEIVALSKSMYVMTPFTSLLVLENDDMYTQYKVERGRKEHWAEYPAPKKIEVVNEPDPDMPGDPGKYAKKLREVRATILVRPPLHLLNAGRQPGKEAQVTLARGAFATASFGFDGATGKDPAITAPPPLNRPAMGLPATGTFFGRSGASKKKDHLLDAFGSPEPLREAQDLPRVQRRLGRVAAEREDLSPAPNERARLAEINELLVQLDADSARGLRARSTVLSLWTDRDMKQVDELIRQGRGDAHTYYVPDDQGAPQASILYGRPAFSGQERIFFDLLAYAPGLNTSTADIDAVLEAEVQPNLYARPGQVDPGALKLLQQARSAGWQRWVIGDDHGGTLTIDFDGKGRHVCERSTPLAFHEHVVCDGTTLVHRYTQLGLAARRHVSRFHREELATLVPWFVPPAEELARGADVRVVGERSVAVVPHGAGSARDAKGKPADYVRLDLVFDENGRLAERQVRRMPKNELLYRQICTPEGVVRLTDGKGKELSVRQGKLSPAAAPDMNPSTRDLVVLTLPYRSVDHVRKTLKIAPHIQPQQMRFADLVQLVASAVAAGDGNQAEQYFRQGLHAREQRQLGLYVLLAAGGRNLDGQSLDVQAEYPESPIAQYLALHTSPVLRQHASQWAVNSNQWTDGLLQHLAVSHALYQRWQSEQLHKVGAERLKAERQKALQYVKKNKDSAFGWVALCLLQDHVGDDAKAHAELAEYWRLFEDRPGLAYAARYEHARSLYRGGQAEEARKRFRQLYEETLKSDVLPALDHHFREALQTGGPVSEAWNELLRHTATELIRKKHRPALLVLARQCWQLEDQPLANHLLNMALDGIETPKERNKLTLAGIDFLKETAQLPEADRLLGTLLGDAKQQGRPELWRLAADIAERREQTARSLECLERALELEYRNLPEVVDLEAVRGDYGKLLKHYQGLADAMVALKLKPPEGFVAKVVWAADRWRALDVEATVPCDVAAKVLRALGDRQLAWDYQTTPVGRMPNEAQPWISLAQSMARTGELEQADLAYKAAYEAEPTNAQVLWDRAQNLRRAARAVESQRLLRQIVAGRWQPRFQPLQAQARLQLSAN